MKLSNPLAGLLLLIGLLGSGLLAALPSDSEQPIEIESDAAEFRDDEGITHYQGNVRLTQGSILLEADSVTLYRSEGKIQRLQAEGSPARYQQTINEAGDKVEASSQHMEYQLDEGQLRLTEKASLTQEGTTLSGSQILYDIERHVLQASAGGGSRDERVKVTIPAGNLEAEDE